MVQAPDTAWGHDMFPAAGGRASSIETGTKLYISNLDYGVSNEDIKVFLSYSPCIFFEMSIVLLFLILKGSIYWRCCHILSLKDSLAGFLHIVKKNARNCLYRYSSICYRCKMWIV